MKTAKKTSRWIGLIALLFILSPHVWAQIDTEFWFAAPDLDAIHAEKPIHFCISTFDDPATVVFEQPANPSYTPVTFHLNANSFYMYDVSDIIHIVETQPYNTVLNYGFHIYSTAPVSVYYECEYANSETYSLKGTNALGTYFIVPSQFHFPNYRNTFSRIEVVATEDDTEVTFLPSVPLKNNLPAGTPITITLNKGQCYAIEAYSPDGIQHIRNTKITSNKPIAVNTSDDSVACEGARDLIGEQLVPVDLLGTDYLALWNHSSYEYLYFFPTENDTKIYLNGSQTPIATLNAGQEYEYHVNSSTVFVHSDKPIIAFQLVSDMKGELGGTILPHINCTGSRKVVYKKNGNMEIVITIVVKTSCVNGFLFNGNSTVLTSSDFYMIPSNPEYSFCSKDVSQYVFYNGLITIENTDEEGYFQLGVLSRGGDSGGTCTYGYFSDYKEFAYAKFSMEETYCEGGDITFNFVSHQVENLTLILPDGTTMTQQPFVLSDAQSSQSGIYTLQGETCNGIKTLDEIHISIEPLSLAIIGRTSIYPATDIIAGVYPYYIDSTEINPGDIHWDIDRDDWMVFPHGASCELLCTSAGRGVLRAWTGNGQCDMTASLVINASFFGVEEDTRPKVEVHPNPASGSVTVTGHDITEVRLFDRLGQLLTHCLCGQKDSCIIDLSPYHDGLYLLEVLTTSGITMKKVIVTHD